MHALAFTTCLLYSASQAAAQGGAYAPPVRYQAKYTQIYFDDIESAGPVLSPAFSLDTGGSITSNPAEVIDGRRSIKGVGGGSFTNFFRTNTPQLSFSPGGTYRVTFRYKILATLDQNGGMVGFFSNAAAAIKSFLPGAAIKGNTGDSGTITLNSTLGPYSDYQVYWSISANGSVAIDDMQILDPNGKAVASEDAEGSGPSPGSGLVLNGGGTVTTDPSLVIGGKGSVHLTSGGGITTNPTAIPLAGNGTYVFGFDYRVLRVAQPGSLNGTLYMNFFPAGIPYDPASSVNANDPLLNNAPAAGRFVAGAQLAGASSYVFNIGAPPGTDILIDNLAVFRVDAVQGTTPPPTWARLSTLPYPRLGYELQPPPGRLAYSVDRNPLLYPWDTITRRLGLMDLITGLDMVTQTQFAGSLYRIRELNPNVIILPIQGAEGIAMGSPAPSGGNRDPQYEYMKGMASEWLLKDSKGNPVADLDYPGILFGDITTYSPVVGGNTYKDYELKWLDNPVSTGVWDGFRFDNFFGSIDFHIANRNDPALLDVDLNRNGIRDETTAMISEAYRQGAIDLAQRFRAKYGDNQLAIANQGDYPDPSLAPYMNGNLFEGFNLLWNNTSSAFWRMGLDMYRTIEATARPPHINLIEGSGPPLDNQGGGHTNPTAEDLQQQRFTLATALLGGAAYAFDLHGGLGAPLWYDEYAVDANGVAVEDAKGKGYLGQALADGTELASPATLIWAEDFESGGLPAAFLGKPSGAVSVTQTPGEVIAGAGSLVVSNPDHAKSAFVDAETDPAAVRLTPGKSYLLTFDWRVLETLDFSMDVSIFQYPGSRIDHYAPFTAIVAGDSGTAHIPFIVPPNSGPWTIRFAIQLGGGKIAFDNIRLYEGGIGPWRRDFENGFVLLNPLNQAHTFSADEIAGSLHRTGVHRIRGTAAPDVNNGQPVTGDLTLGPFDAIILLADSIHLGTPAVTTVSNAAGGQPGVASGAFVSIYGSNFTALPYYDWSNAITNGQLPTQLSGVSVTIGGKPAYIYAVTPGQINVQAPDLEGGPVQVVVTTGGGASPPFTTNSQLYSPAFFPWPGNQPVATHLDYSIAAKNGTFSRLTTVPAKPSDVITLWGTGFGPTNPSIPAGGEPTVAGPPTQKPVSVTLGGTAVRVLGAVLSSYAAVYQIAIQIPASTPDGDYAIVATVNGTQSPSSSILTIQHAQ